MEVKHHSNCIPTFNNLGYFLMTFLYEIWGARPYTSLSSSPGPSRSSSPEQGGRRSSQPMSNPAMDELITGEAVINNNHNTTSELMQHWENSPKSQSLCHPHHSFCPHQWWFVRQCLTISMNGASGGCARWIWEQTGGRGSKINGFH
jgi:hypothetical protein